LIPFTLRQKSPRMLQQTKALLKDKESDRRTIDHQAQVIWQGSQELRRQVAARNQDLDQHVLVCQQAKDSYDNAINRHIHENQVVYQQAKTVYDNDMRYQDQIIANVSQELLRQIDERKKDSDESARLSEIYHQQLSAHQAENARFVTQLKRDAELLRKENRVYETNRDRIIGGLETTLTDKDTVIEKLKRTLKHTRRRETYETWCSPEVNNFVYQWNEVNVCRHFMNGNCHASDTNCPRIHSCIGKRELLMDLRSIGLGGKPRIMDGIYDLAILQNWASAPMISDIRDHMYNIHTS
jgi:hypothetical protein